ncbi:NAD(P)/FAD-dependent oxidoreductase [Candidatus Woesearchaeota archaeon]|nr:NAD(P)/FAD-dependent oxidoreductase [Candidatus Woesearchaeota archaeon]
MDISIIGGGPIGCYLGFLLAKQKTKNSKIDSITIFEEHKDIGKPVQCTGIISKNLFDIIPKKHAAKFIINEIKGTIIHSRNEKLELRTNKVQAVVVDRTKMDNWFAEQARKAGVKIRTNHKLKTIKEIKGKNKIKNKSRNNYALFLENNGKMIPHNTDIIIGADGPQSTVAKNTGLWQDRKFLVGIQARVKGNFDPTVCQLFLGTVCPDFFAWIVPESSNIARIGLATKKNPNARFKRFLRQLSKKIKIIEMQGGLIPLYENIKVQKNNVFLVGDAALQVKQTTGGGIVMGLLAAECLVKSFISKAQYKDLLQRKISNDLELTKKLRDKMNKFSDKKYDALIRTMNKPKNKKLLQQHGDMDFPTKFAFKLFIRNPQLLRFLF